MRIQEELERARDDALYFWSHRDELLAEHPEQWIAVLDKKFVGAADELAELLSQIDERGISRERVFIEYLSTTDDILILSMV